MFKFKPRSDDVLLPVDTATNTSLSRRSSSADGASPDGKLIYSPSYKEDIRVRSERIAKKNKLIQSLFSKMYKSKSNAKRPKLAEVVATGMVVDRVRRIKKHQEVLQQSRGGT